MQYQQLPYRPMQFGPRYRPLRRVAQVSIVLMGLTCLVAVIQSVLMWQSYAGVKRYIYLQVSPDEASRGVNRITQSGPLLNLAGYLFLGTGIAFIIWLYRARENTDVFKPRFATSYQGGYNSHSGAHRHDKGWAIGGWFCPIVQFWYPLQVVQDVVSASEPANEPGAAKTGEVRAMLLSWWVSWTVFWVLLVAGGGFAGISSIVWLVRLVNAADAADSSNGYVDIYDLQTFMVRVAHGVDIGFTVAAILLIVAAVASSLLMLRVAGWQQAQADALTPSAPTAPNGQLQPGGYPGPGQPTLQPRPQNGPAAQQPRQTLQEPHPTPQQPGYLQPEPPQYAPRPLSGFTSQPEPKSFPSYGSPQQQSERHPD
jgi:hypothetical protein